VGQFSLGMRQRLGIAQALLGDPKVLLLDEPANGLDPEGIHWVRSLLRYLADEGRAILVSSHLLGEVARLADDVIVIRRGRIVTQATVAELTGAVSGGAVAVASVDDATLSRAGRRRRGGDARGRAPGGPGARTGGDRAGRTGCRHRPAGAASADRGARGRLPRAHRRRRDRLMGTFRSELRKLTTVRTTAVLTLAGWALVILGSLFLIFSNVDDETGMPIFGGAFSGSASDVAGVIDQIGGSSIIVLVVGCCWSPPRCATRPSAGRCS
jgi:hypothetical protein